MYGLLRLVFWMFRGLRFGSWFVGGLLSWFRMLMLLVVVVSAGIGGLYGYWYRFPC